MKKYQFLQKKYFHTLGYENIGCFFLMSHAVDSSFPGHSAVAVRGYWGPPTHNMGPCGRLGEDPNTWKHFGQEPIQDQYSVLY